MTTPPRVHLQTLGCRLNEAEVEQWARQFQARGFTLVNTPAEADVLVVNTCAVTEEAASKSRRLLRRHQRAFPHAQQIASGCYVSLESSPNASTPHTWVVPNLHKAHLVDWIVEQFQPIPPITVTPPTMNSLRLRGRQRAFLKVQDGCRHQCSFCVIPRARGPARSLPLAEILAEAQRLEAEGIHEILLTGVCLGDYGRERGEDLITLIHALFTETHLPRLRLGALEPWGLSSKLWALFANTRLLPHLHLPLQSGSAQVLKRMKRPGSQDHYRRLIAAIRASIPDITLTTDILVGFPGESDDEWQETVNLVTELGFAQVHIFPFSPRPNTLAATLPNAIPLAIQQQRSAELKTVAYSLRRHIMQGFLGRQMTVLVEGCQRQQESVVYGFGHTPNFLPVWFPLPAAQSLENQMVSVTLMALDHDEQAFISQLNVE